MLTRDPEFDRVQRVYADYAARGLSDSKWSLSNRGNCAIYSERSRAVTEMLGQTGIMPLSGKKVLEIGCGSGRVLRELIGLGANPGLMSGIDLLADRIELARRALPEVDLRLADARSLPFASESFDLLVLFTVFSSILDWEVVRRVAEEVCRVLKRGGAVLFYDFRFNNPRNPNVRGIKRSEVETYFHGFRPCWKTLTVLPPLARKLGVFAPFVYPLLASVPILRTHLLGVLLKPAEFKRSGSP